MSMDFFKNWHSKTLKFIVISLLLLFSRVCDFYSTSLWFFDNPTGEQNLLYRLFGIGWMGLIICNALVVGLIIYCFYYYTYKYHIEKVPGKPIKLTDYISERYYNVSGRFYQIIYKYPDNKNTLWGHLGYTLIRIAIFGSFLATIHNFCQFYNVALYNTFREIVIRPLFVIYGLIFLSFIYFQYRLWQKEFKSAQLLYETENTSN